jgi:acyl-CoA synthetase (AMP-forming)/AMP-acid ligase II
VALPTESNTMSMVSPRFSIATATLVELLQARAQAQPQQLAYRFLRDGELDAVTISYAERNRRGRTIAALQDLRWLPTDMLPDDRTEQWIAPEISGATLAFLHYTSGSTAMPKGVMLTHHNLLHNSLIKESSGHTRAGGGSRRKGDTPQTISAALTI